MRLRTAAATVFATAILLGGAASTASAGEITGNGKPTKGPAHANSICVFSGLEDGGDFPGQPAGPGAPPQNWGTARRRSARPRLSARRLASNLVTPAPVTLASLPAAVVSRLPDRPIRVSGSGRPVTTHGVRVVEV
jgi:hypothetical protein